MGEVVFLTSLVMGGFGRFRQHTSPVRGRLRPLRFPWVKVKVLLTMLKKEIDKLKGHYPYTCSVLLHLNKGKM